MSKNYVSNSQRQRAKKTAVILREQRKGRTLRQVAQLNGFDTSPATLAAINAVATKESYMHRVVDKIVPPPPKRLRHTVEFASVKQRDRFYKLLQDLKIEGRAGELTNFIRAVADGRLEVRKIK